MGTREPREGGRKPSKLQDRAKQKASKHAQGRKKRSKNKTPRKKKKKKKAAMITSSKWKGRKKREEREESLTYYTWRSAVWEEWSDLPA